MTLTDLQAAAGDFWPYLVIVLFGFAPNELWRIMAIIAGRAIDENSEILVWVRYVAAALLAGVVAKLLISPSGALAFIPWQGRLAGVMFGLAGFFVFRRSVLAVVVIGEAALIASGFLGK